MEPCRSLEWPPPTTRLIFSLTNVFGQGSERLGFGTEYFDHSTSFPDQLAHLFATGLTS